MGGLLADARDHEDVVVLPERHQEDEHEERKHEVQPALPAELYEQQHREPKRREVGESDARNQIERRDQAAQEDRQEDRDHHQHDRDDQPKVAGGDLADVVGRRRLAGDAALERAGGVGRALDGGADRGHCVQCRGARGIPCAQRDVELQRAPIGAEELAAGGVRRVEPGRDPAREGWGL